MSVILTNVVEQEVLKRLRAKESFTALDISNALKVARYPFRHREVAEVVRDIYQSGAMDSFEYRRQLIDVQIDGGAKITQAYLYCHQNAHSQRIRRPRSRPRCRPFPQVRPAISRTVSPPTRSESCRVPAPRRTTRRTPPADGAMARSPFRAAFSPN